MAVVQFMVEQFEHDGDASALVPHVLLPTVMEHLTLANVFEKVAL